MLPFYLHGSFFIDVFSFLFKWFIFCLRVFFFCLPGFFFICMVSFLFACFLVSFMFAACPLWAIVLLSVRGFHPNKTSHTIFIKLQQESPLHRHIANFVERGKLNQLILLLKLQFLQFLASFNTIGDKAPIPIIPILVPRASRPS